MKKKKTEDTEEEVGLAEVLHVHTKYELTPLAVDFANEPLNDMARKINQIIEYLHG